MAPLDPSSIATLGNLQLKARHIVEGALSGMHRARLHGSSVEFAEHKEYSPGDEIRHIDWKAYAKVDRYYVKQYEQESQMTVHLLLDRSASMGFASADASKLAYSAHLLAALTYVFIRQRDRVGLHLFGAPGDREQTVPARSRPGHAHDLFATLERTLEQGARGDGDATGTIEGLAESGGRRSLIVLASDLLGTTAPDAGSRAGDGAERPRVVEALRLMHARGHEAVLFHVLDPYELELPYTGLTRFRSLEDDRELLAEPDAVRKQYLARLAVFLDSVRECCEDSGVEYHLVSTAAPIEEALVSFSRLRQRLTGPRRTWSF